MYYGFGQNKKTIHDYYDQVEKGELAVFKGYFLNDEDQAMRSYILDVACNGATDFNLKAYLTVSGETMYVKY